MVGIQELFRLTHFNKIIPKTRNLQNSNVTIPKTLKICLVKFAKFTRSRISPESSRDCGKRAFSDFPPSRKLPRTPSAPRLILTAMRAQDFGKRGEAAGHKL